MSNYSLSRFTSPHAGVAVSEAGSDLTTTANLGQATENFDTNAMGLNIANTLTSAGTIDASAASPTAGMKVPIAAGAAPTVSGFIAYDSTANQFKGGANGSTVSITGPPTLTTIGTTFGTTSPTINNSTFTTGVTLGSALVNGHTYLLLATLQVVGSSDADNVVARIFDSSNSVEIASLCMNVGSASGRAPFTLAALYSGFSGTPTIVVQAMNNTTNGGSIQATATGGASDKANSITAIQVG